MQRPTVKCVILAPGKQAVFYRCGCSINGNLLARVNEIATNRESVQDLVPQRFLRYTIWSGYGSLQRSGIS